MNATCLMSDALHPAGVLFTVGHLQYVPDLHAGIVLEGGIVVSECKSYTWYLSLTSELQKPYARAACVPRSSAQGSLH